MLTNNIDVMGKRYFTRYLLKTDFGRILCIVMERMKICIGPFQRQLSTTNLAWVEQALLLGFYQILIKQSQPTAAQD